MLNGSQPVGLVLAGGAARRMDGRVKALLPLHGRPLMEYALDALRPHCERILISTGNAAAFSRFGLETVPDRVAGQGPMAGLQAGLERAGAPVLVLPCDVPGVRAEDLAPLLTVGPEYDAALVSHEAGLEPLVGLYRPSCLPAIEALLARGQRGAWRISRAVKTAILPWPGSPERLANVNRPEDLARLGRHLAL